MKRYVLFVAVVFGIGSVAWGGIVQDMSVQGGPRGDTIALCSVGGGPPTGSWQLVSDPTAHSFDFITPGVVKEVAVPTSACWYRISQVEITPDKPGPSDTITVKISGLTPADNYVLDQVDRQIVGNKITVDMYWRREGTGSGVSTPYEHTESLGPLEAGMYTLAVTFHDDGKFADKETKSFTVSGATPQAHSVLEQQPGSAISPSIWWRLSRAKSGLVLDDITLY